MNENKKEEKIEIVDLDSENKSKQEEISDKIIQAAENIVNTKDYSKEYDKDEIKLYKTHAILCYLGPLIILPFANNSHKKSKYIHFHINQGLNIIILYLVVFILTGIVSSIFTKDYIYSSYTPNWVLFLNFLIKATAVVINIFGLVNTIKSKSKELPLIGKFKFIK